MRGKYTITQLPEVHHDILEPVANSNKSKQYTWTFQKPLTIIIYHHLLLCYN